MTDRTVVVKRFGPFGPFDSCTIFGKLCRPLGNCSTTISQSLMSTSSTTSSRLKMLHQGRLTRMRLALRNGRSVGCSPSMTRSSTSNVPVRSSTFRPPMCIGRSRYFDPAVSARLRSAGPRSIVSVATRTAATSATRSPSTRSTGWRRRRVGGGATGAGAGSAAGCSGGGRDSSSTYSITTSTAPASTESPAVAVTCLIRPALGDRSSFSIFIASTTTSGWRTST